MNKNQNFANFNNPNPSFNPNHKPYKANVGAKLNIPHQAFPTNPVLRTNGLAGYDPGHKPGLTTIKPNNFVNNIKLPKFLNPASPNSAPPTASNSAINHSVLAGDITKNQNLTTSENSKNNDKGQFSQTFIQDNAYEAGVQRVFRKSMVFLGINLVSFGLLVFSGINFFSQNYWLILVSALIYTSLTNLFYIIVADRNYVWFGLLAQLVLIITIFSFYGLGFNLVTLIFAIIICLSCFLAYSELEKVQLSSRLFSVGHLTNESTRILSTTAILVLALGIYNGILFNGTQAFFSRYIWSNSLFQSQIFQGANPSYSLNRIMVGGRYEVRGNSIVQLVGNRAEPFTFADFLELNYRNDQPVISSSERQEIIRNCTQSNADCQRLVDVEIRNRLNVYKNAPDSPYRDLSYGLDTLIDPKKFLEITERLYLSKIAYFEVDKVDASFIPAELARYIANYSIPRKSIIPALIAVIVFALLLSFKFLLHWIIYLTTWIIWRILLWVGFAQIDIETVEAEIVNI